MANRILKKEEIDLEKLVIRVSNIILQEFKRYENTMETCKDTKLCDDIDCKNNLSVTIHIKYVKRLFTFLISIEKFIELNKDQAGYLKVGTVELNGVDDKRDLLDHYISYSKFDFYIGIFSLFEDFVTLILKSPLTEEQMPPKSDISSILKDEEIGALIRLNFNEEMYEEIERSDNFIPLMQKIKELKILTREDRKDVDFFRVMRNAIHSNGFFHGKPFEHAQKFSIALVDGGPVEYTLQQMLDWSEQILSLSHKLSGHYLEKCIPDNTILI